MITVRFKDTFRERLPEWITSLCLFCWGLILLTQPGLWNQEVFGFLAETGTQKAWGIGSVSLGVFRLVALGVNGAWRPTAHLRALGAGLGMLVWAAIILSYMSLSYNPPMLATTSALFITDLATLWFAAGDAKVADILAKKQAEALIPMPSK